jgi:glutamate decarboxylase
LDAAVGEWNATRRPTNSPELGIHVDGASGGFVAPFAFPECATDFTACPRVMSINVSGHKYGQALAGIGWCLFRSAAMLPKELCFVDKYLGNEQVTATFNFSKSAAQMVGQAYMFLRLGRAGYAQVIGDCLRVSDALAAGIEALGSFFEIISARAPTPRVPLVAFALTRAARARGYDEFDVADRLRERGWVVPAYPLAPGAEDRTVLRVVCRSDFSIALARSLLVDIKAALSKMEKHADEERGVSLAAARATEAWRSAAAKAIAAQTREAAEASTEGERRRSLDRLDAKLRHGGVC